MSTRQDSRTEGDRAGLKPPSLGRNVLVLSTWDVEARCVYLCPLEHQDSPNSDYTNSLI